MQAFTYTANELNQSATAKEVLALGREFINELQYKKAFLLARALEKQLSQLSKGGPYRAEYEKLLRKLQVLSLNFWREPVVEIIFESNIAPALQDEEIPIIDRLRALLIELPYFERDELRQALRRRLEENKEQLTKDSIRIGEESLQPTVHNWLADYRQAVGGQISNEVDRAQYFTDNQNIKKLSQKERITVQRLFELFEYLKLSSVSADGFEEPLTFEDKSGKMLIYEDGVIRRFGVTSTIRKIRQPIFTPQITAQVVVRDEEASQEGGKKTLTSTPSVILNPEEQQIIAAYQGDPAMRETIAGEERAVEKKIGHDQKKLSEQFFKAVQKKQIERTIALLRVMVRYDELENLMVQDAKLNNFLAMTWERQYGAGVAKEFKDQPRQVKFVRLFLQYVLQQRLAMSTTEAARVGMQLGNLFVSQGKKGYNKMAYFDIPTKTFKWFNDFK